MTDNVSPPVAPSPVVVTKKGGKTLLIILVIIVLVLGLGGGSFGWYYYYGPCGKARVEEAGEKISDTLDRWGDAEKIASSTSRISLSGPVADLQEIRRDTGNLEVPQCLETAREKLVLAMDSSIEGYLAFMSNESDFNVSAHFKLAATRLSELTEEMLRVRGCAPFCPTVP